MRTAPYARRTCFSGPRVRTRATLSLRASARQATARRSRTGRRTPPRCAMLPAAPPPPPRRPLRRRITDRTRGHTASSRGARPARPERRGRSGPPCAAPAARREAHRGVATSPLKSTPGPIGHVTWVTHPHDSDRWCVVPPVAPHPFDPLSLRERGNDVRPPPSPEGRGGQGV